ncbi:MAG: VOC family protein [Xanthobacteraceae bacterium]
MPLKSMSCLQNCPDGGQIFMPLDKYPFSPKFGWLSDKFGVSWQLNLASG